MDDLESDEDSLYQILKEEQLEQFYDRMKQDLQVSLLSHLDHVKLEDLQMIGIARPAGRRLLKNVEKRKYNKKMKNFLKIFTSAKPALKSANNRTTRTEGKNNSDYEHQTCLIREEDLILGKELGKGSFGVVKRAVWKTRDSSIDVAVKILKTANLLEQNMNFMEDFLREVSSMLSLNHVNLIKLHGVVLSPSFMMVTELASNGSLRDWLKKSLGNVSLTTLIDFTIQICCGMAYLASKRFLHRDLATRNVLLSSSKTIKIGDFGLVRSLSSENDCYVMNHDKKVPFPWCASESLKSRIFTTASDVWMFGVTLWEMLTFGQEPWANFNLVQVVEKVCKEKERLPQPEACSNDIYQMMLRCWSEEPNERPSFSELQNFFENHRPISLIVKKPFNDLNEASSPLSSAFNTSSQKMKPIKLAIKIDDIIEVIESDNKSHLWKGQNQSTFQIGFFPRSYTQEREPKKFQSSKALKNNSKDFRKSWICSNQVNGFNGEGNTSAIVDLLTFPNKDLPPIPNKEKDGNQFKIFLNFSDISPKRNVSKQFGYNRFNNDDKSCDKVGYKERSGAKRSQSFTHLETTDGCLEGLLIDFSDELKVEELKAAEVMIEAHSEARAAENVNNQNSFNNIEHTYSNLNSHTNGPLMNQNNNITSRFPQRFGENISETYEFSQKYDDSKHLTYDSPPIDDNASESDSFSDTQWAMSFRDTFSEDIPNEKIEAQAEEINRMRSDLFQNSSNTISSGDKKVSAWLDSKVQEIRTFSEENSKSLKEKKEKKTGKFDPNFLKSFDFKLFNRNEFKFHNSDVTFKSDCLKGDPFSCNFNEFLDVRNPSKNSSKSFSAHKRPAPPVPPYLPSAPCRENVYAPLDVEFIEYCVAHLTQAVGAVSREECLSSLQRNNWDLDNATKDLYRLKELGKNVIEQC